jgi:hypothetical protein
MSRLPVEFLVEKDLVFFENRKKERKERKEVVDNVRENILGFVGLCCLALHGSIVVL